MAKGARYSSLTSLKNKPPKVPKMKINGLLKNREGSQKTIFLQTLKKDELHDVLSTIATPEPPSHTDSTTTLKNSESQPVFSRHKDRLNTNPKAL